MPPCPTCGGFHRPEQPHQPPTVPQAPPEQPNPEPDRAQADAGAGSSETADQSGTESGQGKDEEEENGDPPETPAAGQRVSVKPGVRSNSTTGTVSVKSAAGGQAEGQRVTVKPRETTPAGERPGVSIRPQGSSGDFIPPPPPDGSPAGVWDHYLQALPPTHRNREAARGQINESAQELDRAARIDALADYAHGDEERNFLEFTGYLPTLDEERDEQILQQERQRRARIAAARRAREEYEKQQKEFKEAVESTRAWLDGLPDDQESNALRQQFDEAMGAHGGPSNELLASFGSAVGEYIETRTRSTPAATAEADMPTTAVAVPEAAPSAVSASGSEPASNLPYVVKSEGAVVDDTVAAGQQQSDLVAQGLASSPYASDADYERDVQATGFSKELEELTGADTQITGSLVDSPEIRDLLGRMRASGLYTAETMTRLEGDLQAADRTRAETRAFQGELAGWSEPRSLSDGSLASDPEWQGLLTRMRQSGLYSSEYIDALASDAQSVDSRLVGDAVATLPPELRMNAMDRIEQGEDPFVVVQDQHSALQEAAGRSDQQYQAQLQAFREGQGLAQVQAHDTLFDDNAANAQVWARYSSRFEAITGQRPTGDLAVDQAVWDEAVMRHGGPDVGLRPPRALLQGSLGDVGTRSNPDFALENAAPLRAPIVSGPDVATVTPPRGSVPVPTAQSQSAPPPDIEGWKELGTVYINNEEVSVEEIIRRRLPADNADYGHHLERAEQEAFQYLREGYASGAVQLEQRAPREGTLTREDLGDSFTVDGVSYSTAEYFGSVVQTGPRASQLQRHHEDAVQRKLEALNELWREGRVGVEGRPESNVFTELPGERSHLGRGVDPLDYIVPGYALGTEVIGAQDVHTRHGTGIAPEESAAISREGAFSTIDLFPLPVGAALKTAGRGSGVLFDASGNILRRGTLPASTPQGVVSATNRQAAELIAEGMEPAMARNVAAQSQGFNDGMELAYWRGLYERHGAGHPTVVSMLPQNRGPGTVVASGITTPRPPQPAPPLRYGPSQPGLRTPKYLAGDQHRVRITGEPDRTFEMAPIQQEIGGVAIQRGQYYMGDAGPSYTTGLQSRLDSGTGGGSARPGDFGSPHVASPPAVDVPVASSGRGSGPVATLERASVDVSSLPALQLPTTEVSTRTARSADPERGFSMAAGRQTEDIASGPARSSTGAVDYSFLDSPYGTPDYPGVSPASPQIIARGHSGLASATPLPSLRYRGRTATPGTRPSAAAQSPTAGVAEAPLVQTPSGLYVPAVAVSPALTVAQRQRTADAVETATVVDQETGIVADVPVDPETGTVVGTDRETGTMVVVDGRTGTARVIEPSTGLRTGVEEGLTTRAFPGERLGTDTNLGPGIRPFTGQALSVRPDVGVRTRLVEDTVVQVGDDALIQAREATGLQRGLATNTATGVETDTYVGTAEFTVPEFRVPRDFPELDPVSRPDVPEGERIRRDDPGGRPRLDDPESRRRRGRLPRPDIPATQVARQDETAATDGHPIEAEFYSLERNTINFETGEITEEPVGDTHLKTLQVTKRGPRPTEGASGDTGAVTVVSRRGRAEVEDEKRPRVTPREGVMKPPRPASSFPRGGGRRRRHEDFEEYNGRSSQVVVTLR